MMPYFVPQYAVMCTLFDLSESLVIRRCLFTSVIRDITDSSISTLLCTSQQGSLYNMDSKGIAIQIMLDERKSPLSLI